VNGLADCRVAIVGLGLMGGSLAGALRGRCRAIVGVARRRETIERAHERGLIDEGTTDAEVAFRDADIVVLATPVRTIVEQLRSIAPALPAGCLVMDLGSTKAEILTAMERLPDGVEPLGAHPMCGKETSGVDEADPGLYRGCTFNLCPLERTSDAALALGREMVGAVGAEPLVLGGARQDRLVATLSHLPYLLACALVQTADATTSADPAAWAIVAGGYRDTSRVAGSDVRMMIDILETNREAVLRSAAVFRERFDRLVGLIEADAEEELEGVLSGCRDERRRMFP
jgi:prephenate dehydrogenase